MAVQKSKSARERGRKWATQRLPQSLVLAIRQMAEKRGVSPAEMVALAFESNPDLEREFRRALNPWAGLVQLARDYKQSLLPLDGDAAGGVE